jgi:hypothetical protein
MKNILFVTIFILINTVSISALEPFSFFHFIGYSSSYEFDGNNYFNHGPKLELFRNGKIINNWGSEFQFRIPANENETEYVLNSYYNIMLKRGDLMLNKRGKIINYLYALGTNVSYNISTDIFGISPQISIMRFRLLWFLIIRYKYNIYINGNNSHEIGFYAGFINPIQLIVISRSF